MSQHPTSLRERFEDRLRFVLQYGRRQNGDSNMLAAIHDDERIDRILKTFDESISLAEKAAAERAREEQREEDARLIEKMRILKPIRKQFIGTMDNIGIRNGGFNEGLFLGASRIREGKK